MRVLVVSPYHAGSHRAWAEGYAAASGHEVELVTMTGRFWKWRMHGGAVTLAEATARSVARHGRPDVVLATDMVDLPTYLGLSRSSLGDVPAVLYLHENQLTYPVSPRDQDDLTYGLMNWKSMLVADRVVFNSGFHRQEVFGVLPGVLKNFPDYRHSKRLSEVEEKSSIAPVGVDLSRFPSRQPADERLVLWNQRWEHDKNPEEMIRALATVAAEGIDFDLALCGENFRNEPSEFLAARDHFDTRLRHFGWAEEAEYRRLVADADVVLSTAYHEFFGIAVIEALALGAFGVLPDRLSYPELLYPATAADHLYEDHDGLLALLRRALTEPWSASHAELEHYRQYDWSVVAPAYDRLLAGVL